MNLKGLFPFKDGSKKSNHTFSTTSEAEKCQFDSDTVLHVTVRVLRQIITSESDPVRPVNLPDD